MGLFSNKTQQLTDKEKFAKVSYSQCGEDMIVKHLFGGLKIEKPSYIDIGAHHPFYMNNTAIFSLAGARGINIEPDPSLFSKFTEFRKEDVNLNIGISDAAGESDFYLMNVPTLNTFSKETAEEYQTQGNYKIKGVCKIKTETVHAVIKNHAGGKFPDYLSLDAEGVDELILNSIDFENNNCPLVICIETISFSEKGLGVKNNSIIQFLESKNYLHYADTNINSIFVLKDRWENL
jgi:FkbM family methyltransferase